MRLRTLLFASLLLGALGSFGGCTCGRSGEDTGVGTGAQQGNAPSQDPKADPKMQPRFRVEAHPLRPYIDASSP